LLDRGRPISVAVEARPERQGRPNECGECHSRSFRQHLFILTHELGYAVVSEMGLPVLGRLEDAAALVGVDRNSDAGMPDDASRLIAIRKFYKQLCPRWRGFQPPAAS
jgi:hypothetical protein